MSRLTVGCVLSLALITAWMVLGTAAQQPTGKLPGARETINAAEYPSLQSALDALPDSGGVVCLPVGIFEIREPLRIRSEDVLLVGQGTATHIKNLNTDGQPALVIKPNNLDENSEASLWRVQLSRFRITGHERSGHGIVARKVNEIFLDGISVSEHGGDGIRLDHCYEDPRITNCLITYNKAAGLNLLGCHDIVVSGNQFEENQDALLCSDGFNLCMTGNCLDDHLRHGVVIENTYGSVLSGNMIEECQGTAIILDRDCYGITLSANVIAHEFSGGIDLRDAHGCAVSANTFTIVKQDALRIGPASGRITVTGNNFSNSYIGDDLEKREKVDAAASAIVLEGTRHVAISGNLFAGVTPGPVEQRGAASEHITMNGNHIVDQ